MNAAARLTSRLWLDLDARNFWIRDSEYHNLLRAYPQIRTLALGFGLTL
jgi:hypothetical protein